MDSVATSAYIPNSNGFSLAIMNCHYIRYPLSRFFDAMVKYGFSDVELFGAIPHFYMEDVDDALIDQVLDECRAKGLRLVSLTPAQGAYPVSIAIREEAVRRRSIRHLKKSIEAAEKMGITTMLVSSGFGYQDDNPDIAWGLSRESLTELAEYGGQHGVTLMLEPLTRQTSNVVNTSAQAARMLREVNSPHLKAIMDIGVMTALGESVAEYFQNLGEHLIYIHFTDGPGAHVALGDGSFPMERHAQEIRRAGYTGRLSLEINDRRYLLEPERAMEQTVRWLKDHGYSD